MRRLAFVTTVYLASVSSGRDQVFMQNSPTVNLAHTPGAQGDNSLTGRKGVEKIGSPTLHLADIPGAPGDNSLIGRKGVEQIPQTRLPALLISYAFLKGFLKNIGGYAMREWVLDSGAFSAKNSGTVVTVDGYLEAIADLRQTLPERLRPKEIYALDVIGDAEASLANCRNMWARGVEAIPTYHYQDGDEGILREMLAGYEKIAIGGVAKLNHNTKLKFCEQVFARAWPKKIHGFGCASEDMVMSLPFHSVDSTSWESGPCCYGNWRGLGGRGTLSWRGSSQNLRVEIEYYLDLEEKARWRWQKEMAQLEGRTA